MSVTWRNGDEAFAGYHNYRNLFWLECIKKVIGPLRGTVGFGMELLGRAANSRVLKKYAPLMNADLEDYYFSRTSTPCNYFNRTPSAIYSEAMSRSVSKAQSASVARNLMSQSAHGPLEKMMYVDTKIWLPDDLLIKADRMTMANSVELRVPFLDHKVLEFAARLRRNQKVRGWKMKYLLKKALARHIPTEILHRRKVGFPVPYENWLRHDLKDQFMDILLDSKSLSRGYFRKSAVQDLFESNSRSSPCSSEIFSLVVLELWHRAFIDGLETPPDLGTAGELSPVSATAD